MRVDTLKTAENIFNRYEKVHSVIEHYYGILAYFALGQVADAVGSVALMKKCVDYLKLYPDKFEHPHYNFECYRVGGTAKAWLYLKGYMPDAAEELQKYADITMNSPHCEDGIISHPENDSITWIDIAAFILPFMLYTGLGIGEQKYIDYAAYSCIRFYDELLDRANGLLHQCRGFLEHGDRVTSDHWSRGNGWGYLGITELMQNLPEDSEYKEKAIKYYISHTDALIENQTKRGLWRQEIPEELAWYESSGTGLILYGIGVGLRLGILKGEKYEKAFRRGIEALGKYCITKDYMTRLSCPGCLCPGEGAEKGSAKAYITEKFPQDDEPHSYGCIMLALVEAYKNGITEIEIAD